ncbi:MAG TPA: hypothetical protein VF791_07195 [Pyrinomonadaceae bacterium]
MTGKKIERGLNERLDSMGREIVRASAANEMEADRVTASPFLYTRLRSRINTEREGRKERENWLALVGVIWRAVPAMALVMIFAFVFFLSVSLSTRPAANFSDEALLDARDAEVEQMVFADNQSLSSDDVLGTILNEDEREASR